MRRGQFLRSIVAAIVAPKLLTELNLAPIEELSAIKELPIVIGMESAKAVTIASTGIKRMLRWKISNQMLEDEGYVGYLMNPETSPLLRLARMNGIDLNKPYYFQVSLEKDDFIRNIQTIEITQYEQL